MHVAPIVGSRFEECAINTSFTGTSLAHAARGSRTVTRYHIRRFLVGPLRHSLGWEDSMRSIGLMAATTVMLTGLWSCGDGGTEPPPNRAPTAAFTSACTGLACTFTNTSSDPDEGTTLTYSWNFGEANSPTNTSTETNPSHTYAATGTYTVSLTANDGEGGTHTATSQVTVTPANAAPTAAFTFTCTGLDCTFTDTSSDPDGSIAAWSWAFGDPASGTAAVQHPTYRYTAAGTFNVTLTVTDNLGATNSITQPVTVSGTTAQDCTPVSGDTDVICNITVAQRSTIAITLTSEDCEIGGNRLFIPPPEPRAQTVFFNVCSVVPPETVTLIDPAGAPLILEAGTLLPIQFHRGNPDPEDPPAGAPAGRIESTSANNWTISIDDGGNIAAPRDFTDAVLSVVATPAQ
jgi:PKD repeat protein